ncbi:DUF1703-domain-containing protein [Serendipita vermifera]|nr:DUF1703-domain-containing protein [Serendipita vermifera]
MKNKRNRPGDVSPEEDKNARTPVAIPAKRRRLELLPMSSTIYRTEQDPENLNAPRLLPTQGGFHEMTQLSNLIAADKTQYIERLDQTPRYSYMFLRPRGWGKSTFLQTLTDYYDKAKKDSFNDIFGDLYIGKHPTQDRNRFLVLRFDFSEISGADTREGIAESFNCMVNTELKHFLKQNQAFLGGLHLELVHGTDGTRSLKEVLELVERKGEKLFVGVDEYDAPANAVLFDSDSDKRYQNISHFCNTRFFSIMKQNTLTVVDKYWITGVQPVFRDGISPLNDTQIISNKHRFNGLCGLTDTEVRDIAEAYLSRVDQKPEISKVVEHLKRWYNGYLFYQPERGSQVGTLYNPKLVFKYLRGLANKEIRLAPLEEINALHTPNVLASLPDTGEAPYLSHISA